MTPEPARAAVRRSGSTHELPMLASPLVGFVLVFALMVALLWGFLVALASLLPRL